MRSTAQARSTASRVDLDQLRELVSVSDALVAYGHEMPSRGNRARCPICTSSNPQAFSFERDVYHCFRCGSGGDVFALVQALYRCTFPEAIAHVARLAGLPVEGLPQLDQAAVERRQKIERRRTSLSFWRRKRLSEWLTLVGSLTHDAELLARHYAKPEHRDDTDRLRFLGSVHDDLARAEYMAGLLSVDDEAEWAQLWLAEQRGEVFTPAELQA